MTKKITLTLAAFLSAMVASSCIAQSDAAVSNLVLELNSVANSDGSCRITFMAENLSDQDIEQAVFETVIITKQGKVDLLTLFDFQQLPSGRPRVRQFELADIACADIGRVLINGAHACAGDNPNVCTEGLILKNRTEVELLG